MRNVAPDSPEDLFLDLKGRSPEISFLWAHQADMLRDYAEKHLETNDLALELPTGPGTTLIGHLIAEYRRRSRRERVVYLCPTRQLAHQVHSHSRDYGIDAKLLLRPTYEGLNDYRLPDSIAITTYSSLFNSSPQFNDPQLTVMDDAHAAEGYIINPWNVEIHRSKFSDLYLGLLGIVETDLGAWQTSTWHSSRHEVKCDLIDMVPGPVFYKHLNAIRDLLDSHTDVKEFSGRFAWQTIRDHLHACCMFISWSEMSLRPVVPPSRKHAPFADSSQ